MTWPPISPFDARPRRSTKEIGSIDLRQCENAEQFIHEVGRVVSLIGDRPHKDIIVDYSHDDGEYGSPEMVIEFTHEEVETPAQVQVRKEQYDAEQARAVARCLERAEELEREARRIRDDAMQALEKIGK